MSQIVFQQEMFFEKHENKKLKKSENKKPTKNYTEIMIVLSYVRKEQEQNEQQLGWGTLCELP